MRKLMHRSELLSVVIGAIGAQLVIGLGHDRLYALDIRGHGIADDKLRSWLGLLLHTRLMSAFTPELQPLTPKQASA